MLVSWFASLFSLLAVMAPIAIIISLPAFYILYKKKRFCVWDIGLIVYATALWGIIDVTFQPLFGRLALPNMFVEGFLLVLISILMQYLRIWVPERYSVKLVSFMSILITMILTLCIYYFMPSLGIDN